MSDDIDGTMFLTAKEVEQIETIFLTTKEAKQIEEALGDNTDDDYDEDYNYRVAEGNNGL